MGTMRIYLVRLEGGRSNRNYVRWHENIMNLSAKEPGFAGIFDTCLLAHHQDAMTVHLLCSEGFKKATDRKDVTVTEITRTTLASPDGVHRAFRETIEKVFLPYDSYSNIA